MTSEKAAQPLQDRKHRICARGSQPVQGGRAKVLPHILKISAGIIAAAMFFIIALLSSTELIVYGIPGYFQHEFTKYDVYADLPMSRADVDRVMSETMDYLRGGRESLEDVTAEIKGVGETAFYSADEVSHMADVRVMFIGGLRLRNILAAALVICAAALAVVRRTERRAEKAGRDTASCVLRAFAAAETVMIAACAATAAYASTDFTGFFTKFHEIFFPQGNWEFDPAVSRMINMLPEGLFSDTALYIVIAFAAVEVTAIAAAWRAAAKRRHARGRA